ncbi:Protein TANC2, partial [Nibea albiflora]
MIHSLQSSLKKRFRGIFVNVKMLSAASGEELPFADPVYIRSAILDPAFSMMWLQHDVLVTDDVKNDIVDKVKGEDEELGPPPSVDEAADALMTRLGFLLGEKAISGEPGSSYHAQDDGQRISPSSSLASSSASPCSTLQPPAGGEGSSNKHASPNHASVTSPTSTLESRDSGIIATLTSYSAESAAERDDGTKYPADGYHGSSLNLWQQVGRPVVASTSSSSMVAAGRANDGFLYRVEDNMAASTYSLNKLHPDRGP